MDDTEAAGPRRSLGFPDVADGAALFTDRDRDAIRLLSDLTEVGLLDGRSPRRSPVTRAVPPPAAADGDRAQLRHLHP